MSHILFMSSDPVLKEKNIEILRQSGLETSGAAECLQGLTMLDKNNYDVVVIDDELTDASGYEACLKVRQQSDVPIVLLGSGSESEVWSKVEELGFDLYLRKPVSPRELLARIKALLRRPSVEKKMLPRQTAPASSEVKPQADQQQRPPEIQVQAAPPAQQVRAQPPLQQQIYVEPSVPQPGASSQDAPVQNVPPQQIPIVQQPQQPPPDPQPQQTLPPVRQAPALSQSQTGAQQYVEPPPTQVPPLGGLLPSAQPKTPILPPQQAPMQLSQQPARPVAEDAGISMMEDARIIKLVDALVSGKLADINPTIDFNLKNGYAYPAVETLLDTSEQETLRILETLADNGILIKQPFEKFYVDPDGLFQLVPVEHCPRDDSSNLIKGQLVEHFSCGYVGMDRDYKQESRYVCPKCKKDLRLIGTDYRNIGIHYKCQDCGEVFTAPVIKWRNLKSRREWSSDELREMEVYSYRFSPDKKGWLEFQLKPKTQLVDFLRLQGYQVQELAQLTGKSGAVHTFDVLAIRDDILTKINLGIGILVASTGDSEVALEALFKFDTRAYDIGINYKVVIAIPKLGQEAMNFADRQMIRAFEAKTLASVVSDITGLPHSRISLQSSIAAEHLPESASATGNARAIIVRFLRNRGYEVFERALIAGKSGVDHIFDVYARRDDRIIVPTIAIGVVSSPDGQPVGIDEMAMFDAAAFDSGIRNKVFLGLPQLSVQARQFARQQKIDIIEQQDLGKLM
jgi:CheY-like chemotaxis protein/predicted RNA-binding Zn-ribbon protein involved in translation (DUF1610 family)